jgi:hypothetical protein
MIHFVASWAEPICGPHRSEVASAAQVLGLPVVELDVDAPSVVQLVRNFEVMNVPAVVLDIDGRAARRLIGAHPASRIVDEFRMSVPK